MQSCESPLPETTRWADDEGPPGFSRERAFGMLGPFRLLTPCGRGHYPVHQVRPWKAPTEPAWRWLCGEEVGWLSSPLL